MFNQETADAICDRIAAGESLRGICRSDGMPAESTVRLWVLDDVEKFAAQYARAREVGYDCMSEEILELADTSRIGKKTTTKATGTETTEGDMVERSRLQIEARKWLLSKMLPKRYGDKIDLNHSGRILGSREMTEEELVSIAAGSSV